MGLFDKIKSAFVWGDAETNEFEKIISETFALAE